MKMNFESPVVPLQVGDVITSKKGFIVRSPVTKVWYVFHKQKYLGDGKWEVIGDKVPVDYE